MSKSFLEYLFNSLVSIMYFSNNRNKNIPTEGTNPKIELAYIVLNPNIISTMNINLYFLNTGIKLDIWYFNIFLMYLFYLYIFPLIRCLFEFGIYFLLCFNLIYKM